MEFAIIWLGCGIASAIVANNKGRSGCGFLLLGFFLGPIGLILALVVSPDQTAKEKKILDSNQGRRCPYCAEVVRREAIKCRFCGERLPEQEAPEPDSNQEQPDHPAQAPSGEELSEDLPVSQKQVIRSPSEPADPPRGDLDSEWWNSKKQRWEIRRERSNVDSVGSGFPNRKLRGPDSNQEQPDHPAQASSGGKDISWGWWIVIGGLVLVLIAILDSAKAPDSVENGMPAKSTTPELGTSSHDGEKALWAEIDRLNDNMCSTKLRLTKVPVSGSWYITCDGCAGIPAEMAFPKAVLDRVDFFGLESPIDLKEVFVATGECP